MQTTVSSVQRDNYQAIMINAIPQDDANAIRNLVKRVADAEKVDEHGGWDFGIQQLTRSRSRALNWDLYGYGHDIHSGGLLAVIQVREWTEGKRWNTVRKSYFLLGENEDGSVFAHTVSHAPIFAAIKAGRDVVLSVQNWIFGGDYAGMVRQGDLALLPMKSRPAGTKGQLRRVALLEDSHELRASQIADVDGRIYARNPQMRHIPGTHPDVSGDGWFRVVVGQRASAWNFARPTID